MAATQRDVRNRISAVKNIQKITRAMEMVAAARLRRAEQRIEALRPYAGAIRRMTREAAEAAGNVPRLPILAEHESINTVGLRARPRNGSRVMPTTSHSGWRWRSSRRGGWCAARSRAGCSASARFRIHGKPGFRNRVQPP